MISKRYFRLKKNGEPYKNECLCRRPELIENYAQAVLDTTQIWECHHRRETHYLERGKWIRREQEISKEQLIDEGVYFDVPPEELIFLTHEEHFNPKLWHKRPEDSGTPPKKVLCVETGKVFESTREAERQTGIYHNSISAVCKGRKHYKTAGGFHWQYYEP